LKAVGAGKGHLHPTIIVKNITSADQSNYEERNSKAKPKSRKFELLNARGGFRNNQERHFFSCHGLTSPLKVKQAQRIVVKTDVLYIEIDSQGGDVRVVDLVKYPQTSKDDTKAFRLMSDANKDLFIAQSGFAGKRNNNDGTVIVAPNHNSIYKVEKTSYKLADGKDVLKVNLFWNSPDNVLFLKSYEFKRGSYQIKVSHTIKNNSGKKWRGNLYQQLQRLDYKDENQSSFIYTYTGGVLYSPEEKYEKIKFSDMEDENLKRDVKDGWAAIIQHYFLAAWVPPIGTEQSYFTRD